MKTPLDTAKENLQKAKDLEIEGKYQEAIECLKLAVPTFKEKKEWTMFVDGLNVWVRCFHRLGKYDEGIEKAEQALSIAQQFLGKRHPGTARIHINTGACYYSKGLYDKALEYFYKSLKIRLKSSGEPHLGTAMNYNSIGYCYHLKGLYDKALEYFYKALKIKLKSLGETHPETAESYTNISACYTRKGFYDKALEYSYKSLKIRLKILGEKHPETGNSYSSIGVYYYSKGFYDKASEYFYKALNINLKSLGKTHSDTTRSHENIGVCYLHRKIYNKALEYFYKALKIKLKSLGETHPQIAVSYNNIGSCYYEKGNYDKGLKYLYKSLKICLKSLGETHPDTANSYSNMGGCYYEKGNYDKGLKYFYKSLKIRLKSLGEIHPKTADSYRNIGELYQAQKKYFISLNYLQKALQSNLTNCAITDEYYIPKLDDYLSGSTLLDTLKAKTTSFYKLYQSAHQFKNLQAALFTTQTSTLLINHIRQSLFGEGSKLTLAKEAFPVFNSGIQIALDAARLSREAPTKWTQATNEIAGINQDSYPKASFPYCYSSESCQAVAFQFSEQSKAIVLLSKLNDQKAKQLAGIPKDLQDKEADLMVEINYLKKQINQERYKKDDERDEQRILDLQSQHFDYKQDYEALIQRYEKEYPSYYQAKHDTTVVTVAQIQEKLTDDTALISYFVGEEQITIFAITNKKYQVIAVDKPTDFELQISDFISFMEEVDKEEFINMGLQLYQLLIAPIARTIQDLEELIIIPDAILSQLPFEALCTQAIDENTKYANIPYLLLDYEISYHYSATLWYNDHKRKEQGIQLPNNFIGFAPIYKQLNEDMEATTNETAGAIARSRKRGFFKRKTRSIEVDGKAYEELIHSEEEVKNIQQSFLQKGFQADLKLHQQASIQNFKKQAGKYKYVLVAAHGDYQSDKPELSGIVFSPPLANEVKELSEIEQLETEIGIAKKTDDTILHLADAYELRLQADLVVLSCCESGIGQQHQGEGMMGINRAFLYAGAKNVVYTLFKVYDDASSQLTQSLFEYILAGKNYKQALRQAKLDMIRKYQTDPYCWAGYVMIGEG